MEPISLNRQGKSLPLSGSSQSVKKATKLIASIIFFFVFFHHSDCVFPLDFWSDRNGEKKKVADFKSEMEVREKVLEEATEEEVIAVGEVGGCDEEKHIDGDLFVEVGQGEGKNGLLSGEELQRKCVDFIRKTEVWIKFQAQQQQLIIVQ
ncbi:unnamed protein product [Linum trigynum]|uniref:Uncharacterized protein n=1 Tax=Linum trigynum TaxID=586398 RepID=A0AAV2E7H2_9ROSI